MISYESLWKTMKDRGITTYTLIHTYGMNPRTINNLRHNKSITMFTLEQLCTILECEPNAVITFKKERPSGRSKAETADSAENKALPETSYS